MRARRCVPASTRQGAVGVGGVDLEGRGLDAGALGVGGVHDLHGVLVTLGPPQVHAQSISAKSVASSPPAPERIVTTAERSSYSPSRSVCTSSWLTDSVDLGELLAGLVGGVLVVHLHRELDEHVEVVEAPLDGGDARELGLTVAQRARDLLRLVGVVPQVGGAGLLAEAGDLGGERVDVHHGLDVGEGGADGLDVGGKIEIEHDSPDYRGCGDRPRRQRSSCGSGPWSTGPPCSSRSARVRSSRSSR